MAARPLTRLAITLIFLATDTNLLGDGLRDFFDPRLKRRGLTRQHRIGRGGLTGSATSTS